MLPSEAVGNPAAASRYNYGMVPTLHPLISVQSQIVISHVLPKCSKSEVISQNGTPNDSSDAIPEVYAL